MWFFPDFFLLFFPPLFRSLTRVPIGIPLSRLARASLGPCTHVPLAQLCVLSSVMEYGTVYSGGVVSGILSKCGNVSTLNKGKVVGC